MRKSIFLAVFLVLALSFWGIATVSASHEGGEYAFSETDIVLLTEPAVVRVVTEVSGTIRARPIILDDETLSVEPGSGDETTQAFDERITGTGFVVSSDGVIATNAHVVTAGAFELQAAQTLLLQGLFETLQSFGEGGGGALEQRAEELKQKLENLSDEERTTLVGEVLAHITVEDMHATTTVLNSLSRGERMSEFIENGYRATLAGHPEGYLLNGKDVALITIEEENLPTLVFSEADSAGKGDVVYTFGFPGTADVSIEGFLEGSFTQGAVSARKQSRGGEVSTIQTNAKVSGGSSGSPLLNSSGEVIGVVAAQSSPEASQSQGDLFAFAVPIHFVRELAEQEGIALTAHAYQDDIQNALALKNQRHCKDALVRLRDASLGANQDFVIRGGIEKHIEECEVMVASGQSVDTLWDEYRARIEDLGVSMWVVIGGGLVAVAVFGFLVYGVTRRLRRGEAERRDLKSKLAAQRARFSGGRASSQEQRGQPNTAKPQTIAPNEVPPEVFSYLRQSRAQGVTDDLIRQALLEAGWDQKVVEQAIQDARVQ